MAGQADGYRPVVRPDGAHRLEHFQWIARAVLDGCRRIRRCAGWSAATGSSTADSRGRNAVPACRSRCCGGTLVAATKSALTRSMSARSIALGRLAVRQIGHGRRRDSGQLPSVKRLVLAFPRHSRRALAAGMAELHATLAPVFRCMKSTTRRQRGRLLVVPQAEAAGRDARIGRHAGHLAEHQPRAAQRAAAEMHQVEIVGHAVDRRVHRHRRDDDAVRQGHAAQRERREHGRRRRGRSTAAARRSVRRTSARTLRASAVAQAQVLVADALGARQQGYMNCSGSSVSA